MPEINKRVLISNVCWGIIVVNKKIKPNKIPTRTKLPTIPEIDQSKDEFELTLDNNPEPDVEVEFNKLFK